MKNTKYIVIGLIIVIVLGLGCVENASPKSKADEKKETIATQTQSPISVRITPTPMPTSNMKLLIEYDTKPIDKIAKNSFGGAPEYNYPKAGMTYLIVDMKATNIGYQMLKINEFQWDLKASSKDNPNSYIAATRIFLGDSDIDQGCKDAELENGGWTKCKIVFEVPSNFDQYKIYRRGVDTATIEWKKVQI